MSKTIAWAEGTFTNMTEPFTVMLTNEAQQFATDSNRKVTSAQSYYTDIIVIRGSQERTDYTIGNITSGSGITVSKNSKRVTFSVSAGATIGADTGVIEIPITLDGQTVKKQFSWSCGKQGPQGIQALQPTRNWTGTFTTIGGIATTTVHDFNRTPVVGDVFTNLDGSSNTGTWQVTKINGSVVEFKLLSYVNSKGQKGDAGENGSNFAWNLVKGTGTPKEVTTKANLQNQAVTLYTLDLSNQVLETGDKFVVSCDIEWTKFSAGTGGTFNWHFQGAVDKVWKYENIFTYALQKVQPTVAELTASDGKKHLSCACTMKQDLLDKKEYEIGIRCDYSDGTGKIKISNLKIAKEDKESPWCLHPDELKGATGDKGKSVTNIIEYYLATSASSGVTASTSGWSTDPTTQKLTAEKKYLWNCKQTVFDDGTKGSITNPVICGTYGDKGNDGQTSYVHTAYANITYLCGEHHSFTLTEDTLVRYGTKGKWVYKTFSAGTYSATSSVFGSDPYVGLGKEADKITDFSTTDTTGRLYTGQYVDFSETASTDPSKYNWAKTTGDNGISPKVSLSKSGDTTTISIVDATGTHTQTVKDGTNGTPGAAGKDGKTSYFHVKYSNDGGKTFTGNSGEDTGIYMGSYTDYTEADSTDVSKYNWVKVAGDNFSWNPLIGSSFLYSALPNNVNFSVVSVNNIASTVFTIEGLHYKATASNGAANSSRGVKVNSSVLDLKVGDTIALSCDIKGSFGTINNGLCVMHATTTNDAFYAVVSNGGSTIHPTSITDWTRKSRTYTIPSNIKIESDGSFYLYFFFGGGTGSEVDVYVRNVQIEKGNVATPWTPNPDDLIGEKGQDGTSVKITSKSVTYQASTSGTTTPTGTWSNTVPTVNNGQYLWTKTTVQYSDGNKTEAYSVSYKGTNGTNGTSVTVSKTEVTYQVSTSGTTAPTGTWSTTMPTCDQGLYLWTKTYVKYSDGKDTTSYAVSYKGVDGKKFAFNMLRGTNQGSKHWETHYDSSVDGKYSVESFVDEDGTNGVKFICTEKTSRWQYVCFIDYEMIKTLKSATKYVFSCDIKTNVKNGYIKTSLCTGSASNHFADNLATKLKGDNTWEHVVWSFTTYDPLPQVNNQMVYLSSTAVANVGETYIKNLKLTEGTADTPWAPHPKDLEGRGVSQTVQYYLATSQSSGVTAFTSGWSTDITTQKLTADKKYLWNCYQTKYSDGTSEPISAPKVIGVYGDKGQKGDNAKNLTITPSSQYFKSTDGGKTFAPNTITIKPTIQGEISFGKWQYSIDGGVSFADVMSGQKGLTISNNVLSVSKDSSLYSDAVTMVTFRAVANDSSFYDTCSIAKIYDVSDIGDGRNLIQKSQLSPLDGAELDLDNYIKNGTVVFNNESENSGFSFDSYNNYQPSSKYVLSYYFTKTNGTMDHFGGFHNGKGITYTSYFVDDKAYSGGSYSGESSQIGALLNDGKRHRIVVCYTTPSTIPADTNASYTYIQPGRGNTNPNFGVKIEELKLEKGSSPTGWSPAPEDLQTAILSTKSEISDVSLKVDKNKQAIEQRVEKTTYQQDLNLVKGDISKANEGLNKWRYEIYPKSLFASEYQGKSTMDVFAKNTNLTPSQSVLINDTDFGKSWAYGDNYIGYALTFVKFSAAKSVAITFKHDDGAHLYLNGKLIGGSDGCNTGSGHNLSLSFVKGWNCLEVVLNEITGGEYIGFGTTISALTECELMNCYYAMVTGRESQITNTLVQTVTDLSGVTTTVGKVTGVIGEDGGKFTEFKNDYSNFKQSMDGFKTTVSSTYVTKNDFDNLEIGGRNLLLYSANLNVNYYALYADDEILTETFKGCPIIKCNGLWRGIRPYFNKHITERNVIKAGDVLTYSIYAKTDDTEDITITMFNRTVDKTGDQGTIRGSQGSLKLTNSWKLYSVTFTVTETMLSADKGVTYFGYEISQGLTTGKYVYFACPKLEKGNKATDYSIAPEDVTQDATDKTNNALNSAKSYTDSMEIGGRNLLLGTYKYTKSTALEVSSSATDGIKYCYDLKTSIELEAGQQYVLQAQTDGNWAVKHETSGKDPANKLVGLWLIGGNTNNFFDMSKGYVIFTPTVTATYLIRVNQYSNGTDSYTVHLWDFKLEKGNKPTGWTPAPEDVDGQITTVESETKQLANQFSWIVKSGTSASNMVLTDSMLSVIAQNIDLTGKVTFNSFDSAAQDKINGIDQKAGNAATAASAAQASANNAKAAADKAQSSVDGLEIGGRNLLVQRNITQGYLSTDGKGSFIGAGGGDQTSDWIDVSGNKYITITLYEDFTNTNNSGRYCEYDADKNCINTADYNPRSKSSIIIELKTNTKYIRVTAIECKTRRYKIETGNKATDWTPAPEDVSQDATDKSSQALKDAKAYSKCSVDWVTNNGQKTQNLYSMVSKWAADAISDTTEINGGLIKSNTILARHIAADSITSDKILAGSVTADKINVSDLFAKNIVASGTIQSENYAESNGSATAGSKWILSDGSFKSKNLSWDASGNIAAAGGKIGKYTITDSYLITGSGATASGFGGNQAFWAGSSSSNDAPFRVGYNGQLVASGATLTNAIVSGDITAIKGQIGELVLQDGILTGSGQIVKNKTDGSGNITSTTTTDYTTKFSKEGLRVISIKSSSDDDEDATTSDLLVSSDGIVFSYDDLITRIGSQGLRVLTDNSNSQVSIGGWNSTFNYVRDGYTTYFNINPEGGVLDCLENNKNFTIQFGANGMDISGANVRLQNNITASRFVFYKDSFNYIESLEANNTNNIYFHSNGYYSFRVNNEGNWSDETQSIYITGRGVSVDGQIGLYSQTMGNYVARYYVAGSTKCTAIGNGSYDTRIYGSAVWAQKAVSTSDVRLKQDFQPLDKFEDLYMQLQPVSFKYIDGYDKSEDRYFGLKAQPTEKLFEDMGENPDDYAMFNKFGIDHEDIKERLGHDVDFDEEHGLDYTNMIALNTHMVQKTRRELAQLEKENAELKATLQAIMTKLNM